MGNATLSFRDRSVLTNDAVLELWLAMLVHEIDKLDRVDAWLRDARDDWHTQATAEFGFGVMPGLDEIVIDDARRDVVISLCRSVIARLDAYGDIISIAELSAIRPPTHSYSTDVPVEGLRAPFRDFITLLDAS